MRHHLVLPLGKGKERLRLRSRIDRYKKSHEEERFEEQVEVALIFMTAVRLSSNSINIKKFGI